MKKVTLFWFRRDLRLKDNTALFHALQNSSPVQPIFIFDIEILDKLPKKDARVEFIHQEIEAMNESLKEKGSAVDVRYGKPLDVWGDLINEYDIDLVYANRDYEPYAIQRDKEVYEFLQKHGISFKAKKDHVVFERDEVVKKDGKPYTVYTPYSKVWKQLLTEDHLTHWTSEESANWNQRASAKLPTLSELGFEPSGVTFPEKELNSGIVKRYHETRDLPYLRGTSRLSLHLRFGTISIRALVKEAMKLNEKYLNELIWRDFYQAILWHFPNVQKENFSKKYNGIDWRNNEDEFQHWCYGQTGYPIVDAGMRELNTTGFLHNRVRMIVASFLCKHLLIDWRWGEAYFAEKLLDFDLASNNGGWQWAAGTGVDAAPYFRIFNPYTQTEKFDPNLEYVKKWVPELETNEYPKAIVDHKMARERCLEVYKAGIN